MSAPPIEDQTMPLGGPVPSADRDGFPRAGVFLLMLTYAFSMLDRQIVNILAEPIKQDLRISDQQLGLLIGLSFAIFYTAFGVPIARLSERVHRGRLIAACLLIWTGFTAACALARSFSGLLAMRIGVAIGEAGSLPAAQSMIADYVPAERRSSAMGILSIGAPLGILLGMAIGGVVADSYGWRAAFLVAGLPGFLLVLVILFTLRDPMRRPGYRSATPDMPLAVVMRTLFRLPIYWFLVLAGGLGALVTYGQGAFLASFLMRSHAAELERMGGLLGPSGVVGITLGLIMGLGGMLGSWLGGFAGDRLSRGRRRIQLLVCASSCLLVAPVFVAAMMAGSLTACLLLLVPAAILNTGWPGPYYAAVASVLPAGMRATAVAVLLLFVNLIGLGIGPLLIGTLSDEFGLGMGTGEGLRWALLLSAGSSILAGLLFVFVAWRDRPHAESNHMEQRHDF